ncbi:MAG TPA: ThiF family adenylyltransferase, partial [Ignavibacteria bacterium]|nr:ThiF family adenylyltransferase [Ignavibacteria bacterium]
MDSINSSLINLYDRQCGIKSFSDKSAMVIGCGGVGSWIALDLALIGVGTIVLIDHDKLESSNLNRTLFRLGQVGSCKTHAVKELIAERRPNTVVLTIEEVFQTEFLDKYKVDFIF